MRESLKFWGQCTILAAKGSVAFANDWAWLFGVPVTVGIVQFVASGAGGSLTGQSTIDALLSGAAAFFVTWLVIFLVRLVGAPARLYAEASAASQSGQGSVRPATTAVGEQIEAPKYDQAQINHIVAALSEFYPIIVDIENALKFGVSIAHSMESILRDNGAAVYHSRMDELRLRLNAAIDELEKAETKNGLYREACAIIEDWKLYSVPFYSAWNDLAAILRELPEQLTASALAIFIGAKKETFTTNTQAFHEWAIRKKQALSQYREHFIRQPAIEADEHSLELGRTRRFVERREVFTLAESACLLAGTEIRHNEITGTASSYLYDIKKRILEESLVPLNAGKHEISSILMDERILSLGMGGVRRELRNDLEISKQALAELAVEFEVEIPGLERG
jgi:hypothetical protein